MPKGNLVIQYNIVLLQRSIVQEQKESQHVVCRFNFSGVEKSGRDYFCLWRPRRRCGVYIMGDRLENL